MSHIIDDLKLYYKELQQEYHDYKQTIDENIKHLGEVSIRMDEVENIIEAYDTGEEE